MQGYFRLGQQQILRAILNVDYGMVAKVSHEIEINKPGYGPHTDFWNGTYIAIERPAYNFVRAFHWFIKQNQPIAFSGLGELNEYAIGYLQWLRGMR